MNPMTIILRGYLKNNILKTLGVAAILGSGYATMGRIGALGFKGNGE